MKLYIAGKVGKNSQFGTQHWRNDFVNQLVELSGLELENLDPFVYATCDVVCCSIEEIAKTLQSLPIPKDISIIDNGIRNAGSKL